ARPFWVVRSGTVTEIDRPVIVTSDVGRQGKGGVSKKNMGVEWREPQRLLCPVAALDRIAVIAECRAAACPGERRVRGCAQCSLEQLESGVEFTKQQRPQMSRESQRVGIVGVAE